VFAEGSPAHIEVRYSFDEKPIQFVETMHVKEKRLLLRIGQGRILRITLLEFMLQVTKRAILIKYQGEDILQMMKSLFLLTPRYIDLSLLNRILRINDMKFRFLTSSDGIIEVSEPEDSSEHGRDVFEPEPDEIEKEDKSNSSEKEDKSSEKDDVKVEDETCLVLCEVNLDVEVKHLRSALQRLEDEMRKLRSELSECHTTKDVKSDEVGRSTKPPKKTSEEEGRSTKSPKKTSTNVKKQNLSSRETALESQNTMLKHALKALREDCQEDKKKKDHIGFIQQVMAVVFKASKVEGAPNKGQE